MTLLEFFFRRLVASPPSRDSGPVVVAPLRPLCPSSPFVTAFHPSTPLFFLPLSPLEDSGQPVVHPSYPWTSLHVLDPDTPSLSRPITQPRPRSTIPQTPSHHPSYTEQHSRSMSQPSTPTIRTPTGLIGKVLTKFRSNNTGSPLAHHSDANYSTPSLRRSSSRSSFHCLGNSSTNPSSSSLSLSSTLDDGYNNNNNNNRPSLDDDFDSPVPMPRFESDVMRDWNSAAPSSPLVNRSPYSTALPASTSTSLASTLSDASPFNDLASTTTAPPPPRPGSAMSRRHSPTNLNGSLRGRPNGLGTSGSGSSGFDSSGGEGAVGGAARKSSFLSRSAAAASGGDGGGGLNKSLSRGWAKSKEMMSGRKGTDSASNASASASEAEDENDDATYKVPAMSSVPDVS